MSSSSSSGGAASARDGCRSSGARDVFSTPFYKHCAPPERKRLRLCRNLRGTRANTRDEPGRKICRNILPYSLFLFQPRVPRAPRGCYHTRNCKTLSMRSETKIPFAGLTGRDVRVAIIDSGVNPAHPHVDGVAGGVCINADGARGEYLAYIDPP